MKKAICIVVSILLMIAGYAYAETTDSKSCL